MAAAAFTAGDIVQVAPPAGRYGGSLLIVARCHRGVVEGFAQLHRRGSDAYFDRCTVSVELVRATGGRIVPETEPGPDFGTVTIKPFPADLET